MNVALLTMQPITHACGHKSVWQRDALTMGVAGSKS
jgi:hypothetical protein